MLKALREDEHRAVELLSNSWMSGTLSGTSMLYIAPEAYLGGPLTLLRTGDACGLRNQGI